MQTNGSLFMATLPKQQTISSKDIALADEVYRLLLAKLRGLDPYNEAFWDVLDNMQRLASLGFRKAQQYMKNVNLERGPHPLGMKSIYQAAMNGPAGVAYKGARRQLHADPYSPNKTFGMRPLWARFYDEESFDPESR